MKNSLTFHRVKSVIIFCVSLLVMSIVATVGTTVTVGAGAATLHIIL